MLHALFAYFHTFSRKTGLTADQILGELENRTDEISGEINIILFPNTDELVTNEDSDDEDEGDMTKDPNHLGKGILNQQAELEEYDEELPDISMVCTYCIVQMCVCITKVCLYIQKCIQSYMYNFWKTFVLILLFRTILLYFA